MQSASTGDFLKQQTWLGSQTEVPHGRGASGPPSEFAWGGGVKSHLWLGPPPQHPAIAAAIAKVSKKAKRMRTIETCPVPASCRSFFFPPDACG